jgi:hypothetical protein
VVKRPSIPILGAIVAEAQGHRTEFLLDDAADCNVISQALATQLELQPIEEAELPKAAGFQGQSAHVYGAYEIRTRITDSKDCEREAVDIFYGVDMASPPVLLGRPWRYKQGIQTDAATDTWCYGSGLGTYRLETAREFVKRTRDDTRIYAVMCAGTDAQRPEKGQQKVEGMEQGLAELPPEFREYIAVFDYKDPASLPRARGAVHSIPIEEGKKPPFQPLYNLSHTELATLREYLDTALANGWIRRSESPAGAPVLFVPKKDGSLRLCVDYRGLNAITIKNRCPLPLISETLDRLSGSVVFSKLDLKDAYHRIGIEGKDTWKTAFRTRYGHFEYLVMPFGLTNAPATFQAYINKALAGYVDDFCVVYLDDILIYSSSREKHVEHVRKVLERLQQFALYANRKKCTFFTQEVEFLGFIVSPQGVTMDESRV